MHISEQIKKTLLTSLKTLGIVYGGEVELQHPADPNHGDYASNIALTVFGRLDDAQKQQFGNPRSLAERIADGLQRGGLNQSLVTVAVAGPGFINVTLSSAYLVSALKPLASLVSGAPLASELMLSDRWQGKRVITEFTDPNPFKELHIGHLYSNTVGEAISRLLAAHGALVTRVCYQGDVGLHVAKSIWGMRQLLGEALPSISDALDNLAQQPLSSRVKFLGQAYARGATAYEEDTAAAETIKQINFMTFKAGQETLVEKDNWEPQVDYAQFLTKNSLDYREIKQLYQEGRRWSLEYFERMYQRIGMRFDDYFFESVVGEYGVKIVREFLAKGVFEQSQGAVIFPGKKYGLHDRVFINSLGLPTYEAKELGLAPEKYRRHRYDHSIIITGNEIQEYFKVLLKALSITDPQLAAKTHHLSHGMVRLPEGKMSSRTGKILTAEWLMDEAHGKAALKVQDVAAQRLKPAELEKIAEQVALGAIKYAFLKNSIGKDVAFSFEDSLSFQGNAGPYLQYTYVRCHSILEKATKIHGVKSDSAEYIDIVFNQKSPFDHELNKDEIDLLRALYTYSEVLDLAAREYAPHHLCTYLYELAQAFNAFYGSTKVLDESLGSAKNSTPTVAFRLLLVRVVGNVLAHGLYLLGIVPLEQM